MRPRLIFGPRVVSHGGLRLPRPRGFFFGAPFYALVFLKSIPQLIHLVKVGPFVPFRSQIRVLRRIIGHHLCNHCLRIAHLEPSFPWLPDGPANPNEILRMLADILRPDRKNQQKS
jgi:hypothetical protein